MNSHFRLTNSIMKRAALIPLLLLSFLSAWGQSITFANLYENVTLLYSAETADGGFVAGGQEILFKTDNQGNLLWEKTHQFEASQMIPVSGGMFVFSGHSDDSVFIMKYDENGEFLWIKKYEVGPRSLRITSTTDGGFALTGGTHSGDIFIMKTDSLGDQIFTKSYGTELHPNYFYGRGRDIKQTTDGGYIIAGGHGEFMAPENNSVMIKLDANGNLEWFQHFFREDVSWGQNILQTSDGGYEMMGTHGVISVSFGYWIKTNAIGELIQEYFGGPGSLLVERTD